MKSELKTKDFQTFLFSNRHKTYILNTTLNKEQLYQ